MKHKSQLEYQLTPKGQTLIANALDLKTPHVIVIQCQSLKVSKPVYELLLELERVIFEYEKDYPW